MAHNLSTPERRAEMLATLYEPEPLYTVAQLAEHFGVTSQTIRNWEKAGKLPPRQMIYGSRLWTESDLSYVL